MIGEWISNHLLGDGAPKTDIGKDMSNLMQRYFMYKTINDATEKVGSHFFGDDNLREEDERLDIMLKRQQLGLPNDTRQFNDEINHPGDRILASLGIGTSNALQSRAAAALKSGLHGPGGGFFPEPPGGGIGVAHDLGHDGLSLFGLLRRAAIPARTIRRATRIP